EQLGAECQVCGCGCLQVDSQPELIFFRDESDHASVSSKANRVTHGEDAAAFQICDNLLQSLALRLADEQNVAVLHLIHSAIALDFQLPVVHSFTAYDVVQIRAERVLAQDTNHKGRLRFGKGFLWTIDKLSNVKQENPLELVLRGRHSSDRSLRRAREQQGGQDQPDCGQSFQATFRPPGSENC